MTERNIYNQVTGILKKGGLLVNEEVTQFDFENITPSNRKYEFEKAGLPVGTVSGNYKKIADNPSVWDYVPKKNPVENNTQRRVRIANTAPLITGISQLDVNKNNYLQVGNDYLNQMQKDVDSRDVICKVNGKKVTDISKHIYIQRHSLTEKIQRTQVLPFVLPIIEKYGKKGKFEKNSKGDYQEVVGRAEINNADKKQNVGISVIVADNGKGEQTVKFISVFVVENRLIKSYPTSVLADACHTSGGELNHRLDDDFQSPASNLFIPQKFPAVNKSLHEQVKDILKSSGLSVGCEDVERASVGRERAWNIRKTNFLFGDDWETIIKSHQYSRKEFKNGSWRYYYDKHDSFSRMTQCKSVPLKISASMSARDIVLAATDYIQNVWLADWKQNPGKAICKELKGKVISFESISYKHLGNTGGNSKGGKQFRSIQNLIDHVRYLPLAKELLENNGIHTQSRYEEFDSPKSDGSIGLVYQTLSGIAPNGDTNNYVQATVSQKKYKGGELGDTVYISVIGTKDIKKSLFLQGFLTTSRCVRQGCESYPATDKTIPRKAPVVNKSILFEFTDLTPNNRKDKLEKAVRILSKQLGVPVAVERLHEHKGEAFAFKAQEELTYKWADYLNNATKEVYGFVCAYFDLPVQNILQKADVLRHKGQILYSPETGKPIKKSDWDNFVKALEKILNRKYVETGKKIILDSQSLGRLLDRMLKYNKLPEVKGVKLSDIRYSGKTFDYIAGSAKNAEKVFGAFDNSRLELLEQSAAERITGMTDRLKNEVKQTLIDGVKSHKSKQQISQDLFNRLSGTNRDFRKIADTEIQNNINNAFLEEEVSNAGEGEKVHFQRMEIVDESTCPFCKKMNGVIAVWSETPLSNDKVDGDPYATVALWEGKDWNGQKDYVANGVFHPYCRGIWVRWNSLANAFSATVQRRSAQYNASVDQAREEWKAKGIDNPNDKTPGYIDRINELYNGAIQKSLTWSGHKLQDRYNFAGLKISIENKKGSTRSGTDKDGHEWKTYMHYDYGYIRGTEGVDGDHLDCYIGDNENAKNVYIIHQNDPVTHKYDEDKCMLGFNTLEEAKEAYKKQYDRVGFMGSITTMSIEEFKDYVLEKENHAQRISA